MTTKAKPEQDFQTVVNKYAKGAIESLREMVKAMEHARACNGECEDCAGTGVTERTDGEEIKCQACDGTGKCAKGKDSDNPDSWHDEDSARQRIVRYVRAM